MDLWILSVAVRIFPETFEFRQSIENESILVFSAQNTTRECVLKRRTLDSVIFFFAKLRQFQISAASSLSLINVPIPFFWQVCPMLSIYFRINFLSNLKYTCQIFNLQIEIPFHIFNSFSLFTKDRLLENYIRDTLCLRVCVYVSCPRRL